ncbi:hypothetical protein HGB46_02540 [Nocardiopsis dassonvillei]|nr:hypothetical protein [Nocardiopsis dassonvillei]
MAAVGPTSGRDPGHGFALTTGGSRGTGATAAPRLTREGADVAHPAGPGGRFVTGTSVNGGLNA